LVNHATLLVQGGGLNILTDPHWGLRCSPVSWAGPKRVRSAESPRWQGKCSQCGEWNTLEEKKVVKGASGSSRTYQVKNSAVSSIASLQSKPIIRFQSGINEFDEAIELTAEFLTWYVLELPLAPFTTFFSSRVFHSPH
jgi:hypothetical protein